MAKYTSNPTYKHSLTIDGVCLIVEYEWCPVDNVIWQINSICVEESDKNIESLLSDGTIDQVCASIYSCRKEEEEEAKWAHLIN